MHNGAGEDAGRAKGRVAQGCGAPLFCAVPFSTLPPGKDGKRRPIVRFFSVVMWYAWGCRKGEKKGRISIQDMKITYKVADEK